MDIVSYSVAAKQKQRIEQVIANPDSTSGIVTTPSVIAVGETINIPAGRTAVLPNTTVNGTLVVDGEVFIPSGSSFSKVVETEGNQSIDGVKIFSSSPIVPTPTTGTQVANKEYVDYKYSGFKNCIINGNFDVWQRDTSGVSTGSSYTADMWKVLASGANTNWSRASSVDFDSYSKFVSCGLKWNGDAASVAAPIEHRIESINAYKLSGKKVTLSFLAKCSANASVNVVIGRPNAVDNFSGTTAILSQIVNLTTTTQKFSVTFDLTNTDVRNGLYLAIYPSVPAAIHWIAQVQLEEGSVATPFENRPYSLELSLCQRYYEKGSVWFDSGIDSTTTVKGQSVFFKVTKRTSATITKVDALVTTTIDEVLIDRFRIYTTVAGGAINTSYTANSEL